MSFPSSLAARLILAVSLGASAIFAAMLGVNHLRSRALLEKEVAESAFHLAQASVGRGAVVLDLVARITENMTQQLENSPLDDENIRNLLRRTLENTPEIFGLAVALEPDAPETPHRHYVRYFHRDGEKIIYRPITRAFHYSTREWYLIPRETGLPAWSEPYYGAAGVNRLMTSFSLPLHQGIGQNRRLLGVVVADVDIAWLTRIVGGLKVLKTGYACLLSKNGTMVTHPNRRYIMNESIFSLAEAGNDPVLREAGRAMLRGESGFTPFREESGRLTRLYYAPIPSSGWTLAIVFPEDELFADVDRMTLTVALIGFFGILLIVLTVVLISRSITRPLRLLARAAESMSEGNFDVALPEHFSRDEVGALGRAFRTMNLALQKHIRDLVQATAERERIEGDLRIAHDIQMSLLPRVFHGDAFRLHAFSEPAREVGGDFYDFFLIDEAHLALVIADVSGKGLPAALFMAMAKTLIKASARSGQSPADILGRANAQLAADNDQCMFVTAFLGILDLQSGEFCYACAGHNPPLRVPREGPPTFLPSASQLVLGLMEEGRYRNETVLMTPGERLFFYTDGVTEAENRDGQFYSDERLLAQITALQQETLTAMADALVADIRLFADGAMQSDDITVLIAEFVAAPPPSF